MHGCSQRGRRVGGLEGLVPPPCGQLTKLFLCFLLIIAPVLTNILHEMSSVISASSLSVG